MEKSIINQRNAKEKCLFSYATFAVRALIVVMLSSLDGAAQYRMEWNRVFGSTVSERASYVMNSDDGGYITCIASDRTFTRPSPSGPVNVGTQFWIQKTDAAGNIVWDKNFGSDGNDFPTCVLKVPCGYLIGGETSGRNFDRSRSHKGGIDYWVIKIDEMGDLLWENSFGGNRDDRLKAIVYSHYTYRLIGDSDSDRGFDKSGPANPRGRSVWEISILRDGEWDGESTYNSDFIQSVSSAAASPTLAMYVVANYRDHSSRSKIALMRVRDSDIFGVITYDSENDLTDGVIETTTDGYLIAATIRGAFTHGSSSDYCAIKIDREGEPIWQKNYGTTGSEQLTSLSAHGGLFVLGGVSDGPAELDKSEDKRGEDDYWLIAIDGDGDKIWDKTLGGDYSDYPTSIAMREGSIVVTGRSSSTASGDRHHPLIGAVYSSDIWTIKLSTGIPEFDEPLYWDWLMVPNPCDEHFEIFWKVRDDYKPNQILPGKYYFTLYDNYNKVVAKQEIYDIKTTIKTANLPSGNYIGHILNEKQQIEKATHIIIKH